MNKKTKEMIAIGASIAAHCQPCLSHHVKKAKELGLSDEEIQESIAVGEMVQKGAISAMRKHTKAVVGGDVQDANSYCS